MPSIDFPAAPRLLHEYTIRRDPLGHWVASEAHGLAEGVFFTCKEACRFALREADGDASRVHLEPAAELFRH
jgi:hypothetical protein